MISLPLLKQTFKSNWKLWCVITGLLAFMLMLMATVMGPIMVEMAEKNGMGNASESLGNLLGKMFYGNMGILLPMVYVVITANTLIAGKVDRGSMAYTLSTPTRRTTVTLTQMTYLIGAIFLMCLILIVTNIVGLAIAKVEINIKEILLLNLGLFLLQTTIGSIAFLFSCKFNLSKNSIALGAGIPVLFYIFSLVGQMGKGQALQMGMGAKELDIFNYFTIISLYDTELILASSQHVIWHFTLLALISIVLYTVGNIIFKTKDLPL